MSEASIETPEERVKRLDPEIAGGFGHAAFRVTGLDCPDCARAVDKSIGRIEGVASADLNFASGLLVVEYDPETDPRVRIVETLKKMGYAGEPMAEEGAAAVESPEPAVGAAPPSWWASHPHEVATGASGALIAAAWLVARLGGAAGETASIALYAAAIVSGGSVTARRAWASARSRTLDMNVLMTIAVIGAAAIGEWSEGATVIFLFAFGGLLEARSLARTRRSIRDLMTLTPQRARVRRGEREMTLPVSQALVGDVMIVRPGERVPLDGRVIGGKSAVDEAAVTGESVPAEKNIGDALYAGTLNTTGLLRAVVTAASADSTLSRVIYMVEEAQAQQAPIARLVDRFTRWYTPVVVGLAAAIAIVPPGLSALLGLGWGGFGGWFYRALVLLVVSCPCALVISTPVAIVSAITRATRDGVLVKGGAFLEAAPGVRAIAFDKTGTLTCGKPEVEDVVALDGRDAAGVLETAARVEAASTHPLARAVVRAAGVEVHAGELTDVADDAGKGVSATLDGTRYTVGSPAQAAEQGMLEKARPEVERLESEGKTVLVLSSAEGGVLGLIAVADKVRPGAVDTVRALQRLGIEHVVMLTGDNERTAAAVASRAGVPEHRSRLLPRDKMDAVRELKSRYGSVAMVGDGVNDAPALALADLGIAMGAAASDTALETADVALLGNDLSALPGFFGLGRRTVSNIRQNVIVSVGVKLAVLALAVAGVATLWMAVFADTGVSLLVTLNGLRLLRGRGSTRTGDPCE